MREVFSSHVNRIGHDPDKNELHVEWDTGKTSVYSGVPSDLADSVMRSWSIGKALHESVKPHFQHRYL